VERSIFSFLGGSGSPVRIAYIPKEGTMERCDDEVEVFVRVMRFTDVAGGEAPAVIVTTFLQGRMDGREIYDHRGELMVVIPSGRVGGREW
jgi:hypothetical protein